LGGECRKKKKKGKGKRVKRTSDGGKPYGEAFQPQGDKVPFTVGQ